MGCMEGSGKKGIHVIKPGRGALFWRGRTSLFKEIIKRQFNNILVHYDLLIVMKIVSMGYPLAMPPIVQKLGYDKEIRSVAIVM